MKNDLRQLLASLGRPPSSGDAAETDNPPVGSSSDFTPQDVDALLQAWQALQRPNRFEPGDVVRWKRTSGGQCLSNRNRPSRDELAVVIDVLDVPVTFRDDDVDCGCPTWGESLDLQLGILDDDGELLVYHYNSSRFEPVPGPQGRQNVAKRLKALQASLADRHEFLPGMLVRWKPMMKNRRLPTVGQVAVVMEVLPKPAFDETTSAGTPLFQEPLDLVLGVVQDGEFLAMHVDSRRLEPVPD